MYSNFMSDENKDIYIRYWLLLITFLVALMIIVGGLTRLTESGLSITKWDVIAGIIPPLNQTDWQFYFDQYKKIPEFKLLNPAMTIHEFKVIFWWEYTHRLLGRIIGFFYILPLIYFTFKKNLNRKKLFTFYLIFFLICLQGFIGWYMVKSGLTERTDVSHYRLSVHLTLAFIIFILLLWNFFNYKNNNIVPTSKSLPYSLPVLFLIFIVIQIAIGAFVSGMDAGRIYQSWPLMNGNFFPDDSNIRDLFSFRSLETPSIVQFIHRNIAYFIILLIVFILINIYRNENFIYLRKTILLIFIFALLQTFLGIFTILSGAQIIFASMHQLGSIFLVTTSLILVFKNSRIN